MAEEEAGDVATGEGSPETAADAAAEAPAGEAAGADGATAAEDEAAPAADQASSPEPPQDDQSPAADSPEEKRSSPTESAPRGEEEEEEPEEAAPGEKRYSTAVVSEALTRGGAGAGAAADPGNPGATKGGAKIVSLSAPGPSPQPQQRSADDRLVKVKSLDRQQLCIDLLMVGCVQSFVDFFYITHRKSAVTENSKEQETKQVEIPEDTLIFLKETLETAENARRSKNYQHCFESYNSLAEYFERVPDLQSAMYFYRRCADVATEVDARESIAKANLNLGSCEEQGKNWQSAMDFHEKALQIATLADSLPLQIKAASRLTHVYEVLAGICEREGRDTDATGLYEKCLNCAHISKDPALEGTACHKLGLSKYKTGQHEPAIELQRQYLEICRTHDNRVGESAARAALAQCYEAIGNTQEAIKQLENLLNVASEVGELRAQASACLNLGILYSGRGDHDKSVELLEQHFDLARQLGDRRLIDSSRVVLGMVRGNGKLKNYIHVVNNDLEKLLKWKSQRIALEGA